jgi:hypothetical protein
MHTETSQNQQFTRRPVRFLDTLNTLALRIHNDVTITDRIDRHNQPYLTPIPTKKNEPGVIRSSDKEAVGKI